MLHGFSFPANSGLFINFATHICEARIGDLITYFHPDSACRRHGRQLGEEIIGTTRDNEAAEEVQVVDVLRADGDFDADSTYKADNIDQNSSNVSTISAPVEAEIIVIR